jgi:hypothetical protein
MRGRCGWSRFRLFAGSARIEGNAIWSVVVGHRWAACRVRLVAGTRAALEAWEERLDALGVTHSGVQDLHGQRGGPFIVLRDPDNIQIDLTAGRQPSV